MTRAGAGADGPVSWQVAVCAEVLWRGPAGAPAVSPSRPCPPPLPSSIQVPEGQSPTLLPLSLAPLTFQEHASRSRALGYRLFDNQRRSLVMPRVSPVATPPAASRTSRWRSHSGCGTSLPSCLSGTWFSVNDLAICSAARAGYVAPLWSPLCALPPCSPSEPDRARAAGVPRFPTRPHP